MMNRQKAIRKILKKVDRVIDLYSKVWCEGSLFVPVAYPEAWAEKLKLEKMIKKAIETDWEP